MVHCILPLAFGLTLSCSTFAHLSCHCRVLTITIKLLCGQVFTRVTRLSGGRSRIGSRRKLVAIVTDTHFKLYLVLLLTDHVSLEEGGE